jgi:PRTRC genetic system protein F
MQLNLKELRLIESTVPSQILPTSFQIPKIHASVPRTADLTQYYTDFGILGHSLLEAGVINPDDVSEDAATPKQVVEQGLRAWFLRRIGKLQHVRFDVGVVDAEHANAYVRDGYWDTPPSFDGVTLTITGNTAEVRCVEDIARYVEARVPDLFVTAFTELTSASYKTIEFQHPDRLLETEIAYSLWGNDVHSVTDEEAVEYLEERYGEGEEVNTEYMPDEMIAALGNGFCYNVTRKGQRPRKLRRFPELKLKSLAKSTDKVIASIAAGLLNLRRACKRFDEAGAKMPHTTGFGGRPYWVGCILMFNMDYRVTEFMDDEHQHLMETGEGTDLFAIEQLPTGAADLKSYFKKLDVLFDLVAQMDAFIPKISYAFDAE